MKCDAILLRGAPWMLGAAFLLLVWSANAKPFYLPIVKSKYPGIVGTRLDDDPDCRICHTAIKSVRNAYGVAWKDNGQNLAAFGKIEKTKSDNDSFENLREIFSLTFPGRAIPSMASIWNCAER